MRLRLILFFAVFIIPFGILCAAPQLDLATSALFYRAGDGFFIADHPVLVSIHYFGVYGGWILGFFCVSMLAGCIARRQNIFGLSRKDWTFLIVTLIVGPILITNVGFKNHWGRARPREVTEFGGTSQFSPAWQPQANSRTNTSFVSGDASFGFFLPCLAYVVPRNSNSRLSRLTFWICTAVGILIGFDRLAMGAHFLSDVLGAAVLMTCAGLFIHTFMYGGKKTIGCWKVWFSSKYYG
jgi:lipid A 4'-phosphatase